MSKKKDKACLYKFHLDCGRMGELDGIFTSTPAEIEKIIGKSAYFGEVLGKHSEVEATIDEDQITLLTDDQDFIAKAEEYGLVPSGFDPSEYIEEDEEDEEEDVDD